MPRLPLSLPLSLSLLIACSGSSQVADGGAQLAEVGDDVPAAACRFAGLGDPSSLPGTKEIINALSERLTAPAGGLWWIAEPLDGSVVAQGEGGAPVELEVVRRDLYVPDRPLATVRVPPSLPAGARLQLAGRELVVAGEVEPLDLASVTVAHTYRPDLGGTGVTARLPPFWRGRVFVADAYVGLQSANVQTGIQVIEELLLADAPSLCDVTTSSDPTEVFVPMWMGQIKPGEELSVLLADADDAQSRRPIRVPRP